MIRLPRILVLLAIAAHAQVAPRSSSPAPQRSQTAPSPEAAKGPYRITGRVIDAEAGGQVTDVSVTIARADGSGAPLTQRSADGSFDFDGLPAAKFRLFAQRRGYESQYYEAHENYFTAIVTGPKLKSEGLVFRIHRDCSISGTVVDENGETPENAQVMLFAESLGSGVRLVRRMRQAQLDADNHFHFAHLKPGHYYVAVSAQPWYAQYAPSRAQAADQPADDEQAAQFERVYPLTFYPGATDANAAGVLTLNSGERSEIEMTLQSLRALKVRVRSVEDQGMQNVQTAQNVFGASQFVPAITTFRQGTTELLLAPGIYTFTSAIESRSKEGGVTGHERLVMSVDVSGDASYDLKSSPAMPQLSGVAHVNGAMPERQLFVELRGNSGFHGFIVGHDGTLEGDPDIEPGTYEVSLANSQGMYLQSISAEGGKVRGRMLTIDPGTNVKLSVEISAGVGRVNGFVRNGDEPVSAAMVLLVPEDRQSLSLYRRDQSDSDGSFQLASVVPGRYTLLALSDWNVEWANPAALEKYMAKGQQVVVRANGEADATIPGQ